MKQSIETSRSFDFRRKAVNFMMMAALVLATVLALAPLFSVFMYVVKSGAPALNWDFFTSLPKPVGEHGGGMSHAITGTGTLVLIASLIGIPVGVAAGVFLSEYGKGKMAAVLRFSIDLLTSIPSIIIGVFVYGVVVVPMKHFSGFAGAIALAIIMTPVVARTTEEILRLVPVHIREAGLALGIPRWKVILRVVLQGSLGGITTGVMLAVARAAGETAPLIFTAFGSQFWARSLNQPTPSLPVQIYTYAISPYEQWHQQAWAGALVLVVFVFVMNLMTRLALRTSGGGRE